MALLQANESDSDDGQFLPRHNGSTSSTSQADDTSSSMTEMDVHFDAPVHPVASMQGAFEESIRESAEDDPKLRVEKDAEARRHTLLEADIYDDTWRTRWQQRSTAKHHPLRKLMAQIVFGMHLLQKQQAKSNEEVVSILQTHVNEVDGFLERTADDFELAITDIKDRMEHLRLPMAHLEVFEYMLRDTKFRAELLGGLKKIEDIIDRTYKAMNATLLDVQQGIVATEELARYMDSVSPIWPKHRSVIAEVLTAMRGNEQGWLKFLRLLPSKGGKLGTLLADLRNTITDMSDMANSARDRGRHSSRTPTNAIENLSAPLSPGLRSKFSSEIIPRRGHSSSGSMGTVNKPLPTAPAREPRNASSASSPSLSTPRLENGGQESGSQQMIDTPKQRSRLSKVSHSNATTPPPPQRPRTAGNSSSAKRNSSAELAEFLKSAGPLRSNPPEHLLRSGKRSESKSSNGVTQSPKSVEPFMPVDQPTPKPKLESSATMAFLGSPHTQVMSSADMQDEGRAMSIRSAPGLRKDGHTFARRISARMKSLPFSDDKTLALNLRKHSTPSISSPVDFRVVDSPEKFVSASTEAHDAVPTQLPNFSKAKVGSVRSQSTRSPSLASAGRSKIRNLFQRGWIGREPNVLS